MNLKKHIWLQNILSLLHKSWIVFYKDVQLELRTRYALNAIALFAVTALAVVSFSLGVNRVGVELLAALLWIILFFAAMSGLAHIFVREEEQQTADTLRILLAPNAVWLGKWLFNIVLLISLEAVIIPLFLIAMRVSVANTLILIWVLLLGSIGLASVATIIAAIIALTGNKGALFAVLAFPIALPVLLTAIRGTHRAFEGASFYDCVSDLQMLFSFSVVIVTTSLLVFEFVWRK